MLLNTCSCTLLIYTSFFSSPLVCSLPLFSLLHLFTFCRLALPLTSASVLSRSLPLFSFLLHLYSFIIFPFCSHALQFSHLSSEISFSSTPFTSFFSSLADSCCSSLSLLHFSLFLLFPLLPSTVHPNFFAN